MFVFSNLPIATDLQPSVECTQKTTQWNKSITHSITGTARHSGYGQRNRKEVALWLLEGFRMSMFKLKPALLLSSAQHGMKGGGLELVM